MVEALCRKKQVKPYLLLYCQETASGLCGVGGVTVQLDAAAVSFIKKQTVAGNFEF